MSSRDLQIKYIFLSDEDFNVCLLCPQILHSVDTAYKTSQHHSVEMSATDAVQWNTQLYREMKGTGWEGVKTEVWLLVITALQAVGYISSHKPPHPSLRWVCKLHSQPLIFPPQPPKALPTATPVRVLLSPHPHPPPRSIRRPAASTSTTKPFLTSNLTSSSSSPSKWGYL